MKIMRNNGMSMIEVVIAIALMGIIAVSILAMFSKGFSFIVKAGDRSKAVHAAQAQVEVTMSEKNSLASPTNLVISFHDGTTITAPGEKVTKSGLFNNSTISVEVFQPTN